VVVRDGAELTLVDISEHLGRLGIAKQKLPERLSVVDQLPRTASGKIQKHLLREQLTRTGS
jgi:non-ribosomal peptide synthetase component E (peptide arylation enzyme)